MSEEAKNDHAIDVALAFKNGTAGPADASTNGDVIIRLFDILANRNGDMRLANDEISRLREELAKAWREYGEQEGRIDRICETASMDRMALNSERIKHAEQISTLTAENEELRKRLEIQMDVYQDQINRRDAKCERMAESLKAFIRGVEVGEIVGWGGNGYEREPLARAKAALQPPSEGGK